MGFVVAVVAVVGWLLPVAVIDWLVAVVDSFFIGLLLLSLLLNDWLLLLVTETVQHKTTYNNLTGTTNDNDHPKANLNGWQQHSQKKDKKIRRVPTQGEKDGEKKKAEQESKKRKGRTQKNKKPKLVYKLKQLGTNNATKQQNDQLTIQTNLAKNNQ